MILHLVNQSPFQQQTLTSCLRFVGAEDSILLMENGVYGAIEGSPLQQELTKLAATINIFALSADLEARGLNKRLLSFVQTINYDTFVDLSLDHDQVCSWL